MASTGIVLAAGTGKRFGGRKQEHLLAGRRLVDHAISRLRPVVDDLVVVAPADMALPDDVRRTAGGPTRAESTLRGITLVGPDVDHVLIHSPSHPLTTVDLARHVLAALIETGAGAVVPVMPSNDTIRRIDAGGVVTEAIERTGLVISQTPQGFARAALARALADHPEAQDDAVAVGLSGGRVVAIDGEITNLHVTTPAELELAEAIARGYLGWSSDDHR